MADIIEQLAVLATELDKGNFIQAADTVDAVARTLVNVKKAQVSVQRLWIGNQRCWGKCYREKRASSPKKSAQEVWMECWSEYNDSLEDQGKTWNRYADSTSQALLKTASVSTSSKLAPYFINKVSSHLDAGIDIGTAIADTLQVEINRPTELVNKCASAMSSLAVSMSSENEYLAEKIASLASEITKEAGIGSWLRNKTDWARSSGSKAQRGDSVANQFQSMMRQKIQQTLSNNPWAYKDPHQMALLESQIRNMGQAYIKKLNPNNEDHQNISTSIQSMMNGNYLRQSVQNAARQMPEYKKNKEQAQARKQQVPPGQQSSGQLPPPAAGGAAGQPVPLQPPQTATGQQPPAGGNSVADFAKNYMKPDGTFDVQKMQADLRAHMNAGKPAVKPPLPAAGGAGPSGGVGYKTPGGAVKPPVPAPVPAGGAGTGGRPPLPAGAPAGGAGGAVRPPPTPQPVAASGGSPKVKAPLPKAPPAAKAPLPKPRVPAPKPKKVI